jgi:hypothetical protein
MIVPWFGALTASYKNYLLDRNIQVQFSLCIGGHFTEP